MRLFSYQLRSTATAIALGVLGLTIGFAAGVTFAWVSWVR